MKTSIVLLTVLSGAVAPPPADLAAWLDEADRASPAIRAARARADAAREVAAQRSALPDPLLSLAYVNDGLTEITLGSAEFSMLSVGWEQEVPHRDVRRGAAGIAEAEFALAGVSIENGRVGLRARVIALYALLWRHDREAEILRESREVAATLAEAALARYESGEGSQEQILRAQVEALRIDVAIEEIARARRSVEVAVGAALGRVGDAAFGPALTLPEGTLPTDVESLAGVAATEAPAVLLALADEERSVAAIAAARAQSRISWSWVAAYQYRGELEPMVVGGIGLRLPMWRGRKQDRALAEAESARTAAEHDREQTELEARARVRDLASEIASLDREIRIVRDGIVPQDQAALEAARIAFSTGGAPMTVALDSAARLLADERDAVQLEAARVAALAELEALTGRSLLDVHTTGRSR